MFLEGLAAHPDRRLADLPILTLSERRRLLIEWNATDAQYPGQVCIHELFEAQAARAPAATTFVCEDAQITYEELNSRSNRLARHLQVLGVGPEVLVGIYIDRSFDFVVALLATFKSGGAYLPLDPSYPKERLAFMLKDAGVSVLLTLTRFVPEIPGEERKFFCLDGDSELLGQYPDTNLATRCSPQQLAYVIYTSGTTGQPNGVAVEHRQLLNRFYWMWEEYPFAPDEVGCQKTGMHLVIKSVSTKV
jgi:non-ribosomal peptide synthetase component F